MNRTALSHHQCQHPWRHRLLTLLVMGGWLSLMLGIYPVIAQHYTHNVLYRFGPMLLALVPGWHLVLAFARWQCQPTAQRSGRLLALSTGLIIGRMR